MEKKITKLLFASLAAVALAGCNAVATKTNTLTDEKIKSNTAGTLGYQPDDLTITNRRTEGVNTYVNLKAKDGKEFTCVINGGNLLSFGMTNPPSCSKKGEPVNSAPFH